MNLDLINNVYKVITKIIYYYITVYKALKKVLVRKIQVMLGTIEENLECHYRKTTKLKIDKLHHKRVLFSVLAFEN